MGENGLKTIKGFLFAVAIRSRPKPMGEAEAVTARPSSSDAKG
jgi:hypothetical protein